MSEPSFYEPMPENICLDRAWKLLFVLLLQLVLGGWLISAGGYFLGNWCLPMVLGWSVFVLVLALRSPARISFLAERQVLEISYLLGGLLRKNEALPFENIAAIQSFPRCMGDNDPEVALEIVLREGGTKIIESAKPEWASHGPLIGLGGCLEPASMTTLRKRIAALVGIEDRGFLGGN